MAKIGQIAAKFELKPTQISMKNRTRGSNKVDTVNLFFAVTSLDHLLKKWNPMISIIMLKIEEREG